MAVVVTVIWVRPNTEVDWYVASGSESDYFKTNFRDNGKFSSSVTISDDQLRRTSISTFPDDAARNEWKADSTVQKFRNDRQTYCTNNSISHTFSLS